MLHRRSPHHHSIPWQPLLHGFSHHPRPLVSQSSCLWSLLSRLLLSWLLLRRRCLLCAATHLPRRLPTGRVPQTRPTMLGAAAVPSVATPYQAAQSSASPRPLVPRSPASPRLVSTLCHHPRPSSSRSFTCFADLARHCLSCRRHGRSSDKCAAAGRPATGSSITSGLARQYAPRRRVPQRLMLCGRFRWPVRQLAQDCLLPWLTAPHHKHAASARSSRSRSSSDRPSISGRPSARVTSAS